MKYAEDYRKEQLPFGHPQRLRDLRRLSWQSLVLAIFCFTFTALFIAPAITRGGFALWFGVVIMFLYGCVATLKRIHVRSGEEWKLVQAEKRARKYGR